MTDKRFIGSSGGVYDQYKSERFAWSEWGEIIQIINNLNEKARERSKALSKLQKENDELKKVNDKWIVDYNGLNTEYQWLKEENNKLKSILEEIKDKNGEIWLIDGRIIRLKKVFKND